MATALPPPQNKWIKLISNFLETAVLTREEMEDSELSSSSEDLKWDGFSSSLILPKASFSLEKKTKVNLRPQRLAPVISSWKLNISNNIWWNHRTLRKCPGRHVKKSTQLGTGLALPSLNRCVTLDKMFRVFLSPGDLPDPGIKPESPALQVDSLPSEPPGTLSMIV